MMGKIFRMENLGKGWRIYLGVSNILLLWLGSRHTCSFGDYGYT